MENLKKELELDLEALEKKKATLAGQTAKLRSDNSYTVAHAEQAVILCKFLDYVREHSLKEVSDEITQLLIS